MHDADWMERRVWLFAGLIVIGVVTLIVLALLPSPKVPSREDMEEHTRRRMEAMHPGVPAGPDEASGDMEERTREYRESAREAEERERSARERAIRAVEEIEKGP